ncbi:MAG: radical SAM protein [Bacteroidetes bacterium]|nr:radical SAM protein [Bacteroidota bacterium]
MEDKSKLDTILVKVASRCNIDCSYCYVYNMGDDNWSRQQKLISDETVLSICKSLQALLTYQTEIFSIVLHGGEPLLLGTIRLNKLLSSLRSILPEEYPISIQTNGILISNEILNICSEYKVSIAISLDGPKKVHDHFRVNRANKGTYDKVMLGYQMVQSHCDSKFLNAGLLSVIDPDSDPIEVYNFFKSIHAPSVDFLYRDGNHSRLPYGKATKSSVEYGKWMATLIDTYVSDNDYIPIRIVDDMFKVMLGGTVSKEGMGLTDFGILIIDTDGTLMKNDTLKSSFKGADKFMSNHNISSCDLLDFINSEEFLTYKRMQRPSSPDCLSCPILNLCGGGMLLHRWSDEKGFHNTSIYCADQKYLADAMRKHLPIENEVL